MRENGRKCEVTEMLGQRINYALNDMIVCV